MEAEHGVGCDGAHERWPDQDVEYVFEARMEGRHEKMWYWAIHVDTDMDDVNRWVNMGGDGDSAYAYGNDVHDAFQETLWGKVESMDYEPEFLFIYDLARVDAHTMVATHQTL